MMESWITVNPNSGNKNSTINVTVENNQTLEDRESTITIKTAGDIVKEILIKQYADMNIYTISLPGYISKSFTSIKVTSSEEITDFNVYKVLSNGEQLVEESEYDSIFNNNGKSLLLLTDVKFDGNRWFSYIYPKYETYNLDTGGLVWYWDCDSALFTLYKSETGSTWTIKIEPKTLILEFNTSGIPTTLKYKGRTIVSSFDSDKNGSSITNIIPIAMAYQNGEILAQTEVLNTNYSDENIKTGQVLGLSMNATTSFDMRYINPVTGDTEIIHIWY